jgi:hypothetical protein
MLSVFARSQNLMAVKIEFAVLWVVVTQCGDVAAYNLSKELPASFSRVK